MSWLGTTAVRPWGGIVVEDVPVKCHACSLGDGLGIPRRGIPSDSEGQGVVFYFLKEN